MKYFALGALSMLLVSGTLAGGILANNASLAKAAELNASRTTTAIQLASKAPAQR
jgi:N-acetylglucosamine-6-phosphate deacetylase